MAKIEGTQSIPSDWKYFYDGTLTPATPNNIVRSRYPWRIPQVQEGGLRESEGQKKQRARWKTIRDKFKVLPQAERQRWYAAAPPWGSLLFYYNYFMMSGLMGNAVVGDKGGGVIKSIQHKTFVLPVGTPANVTVACDSIDPTKSVVFFYGAGYMELGPPEAPFAAAVYPYLVTLLSTYAVVKASMENWVDAGCSVSVIEYI